MTGPRVVVVGGGVAGLGVAYSLRRRGAEVTVLEADRVGGAASGANAGWLCPAQAGPLPEPGLAAYGMRSLVRRDSALYFAPGQLPRMAGWLARFAARCNERDHRRGREALAQLGRRTFELAEQWVADGVDCELHRRGLLVAAKERAGAQEFLDGLEPMRGLGFSIPDRVLSGEEVRDLEPALAAGVTAGLVIEEHWHVHAPAFMEALAALLKEMGVALHERQRVADVAVRDGRAYAVRTGSDGFRADAVVLAAGGWSPGLAKRLGFRLPVQAGKGYSFELRPPRLPTRALLLLEPHVGCSPVGDRLRIAGTMEFSGVNARLDRRRIESIVRGAAGMLTGVEGAALEDVRSGMRPIAPDGLPIVDRAPGHANVYLATAYSMLGMTVAGPAGDALAELILGGRRPPELEPFRADRFGLGAHARPSPRRR